MSNLHDSLSERNIDVSRPSTSEPHSQPFRSKSSLNNRIKDNKVASPSKKSPKHTTMSREKQLDEAKIASLTFTNSSINDLTPQCQNININSESDDVDQGDSPVALKKKNAKKKERLKELHLQMPPVNAVPTAQPQPQSAPQFMHERPNYVLQNQITVQEFFLTKIGPLYASTSSRYLENYTHHPQYQYMHAIQTRDLLQNRPHLASAPHTPLLHVMQRPNSANMPNSSLLHSEPNTPRYLQNALHHPLLCRSFSVENHSNNFEPRQQPTVSMQNNLANTPTVPSNQENNEKKNSPKKKKNNNTGIKKKELNGDDKKFELYMPLDQVILGLQRNTLVEGVIRINPKQFQHAYVSSTDRKEQDVLLDGIKMRNRALEGDVIVVEMINDGSSDDNPDQNKQKKGNTEDDADQTKQKKGKVVYIKEKVHNRACIGNLKLMPDKNRQKALFVPRDHRIPRLNIPFISWPNNFYYEEKKYENTLFLAKIIDWSDTRFAVGNIICNIGQSGDMISETKAILAQTDLDITPYGQEFRDLYPRLDYMIPEQEIQIRQDCRKLCLFSIDPFNCRDIDDAVSCRELDNGNYEIGVHISDVAHFLTENTLLDHMVAQKATTIYLVERAYHMLPDELCMLCSLFPGVDKLAFSVFWEITPDAKILSRRFAKTVIHSCAQLAYEHAQAILDDSENSVANFPETYNGYEYKDICKTIKVLGKIAATLRTNRFDNGALRIDQPKVYFRLNVNDGLPESFWIYENKESHQLIEEFMLLANMTVASQIREDHPKLAFLRCHPPPSGYMMKQLAKALIPMGIELDISSAGNLHRSLQPHVGPESTDQGKAMVLNMLCAKPMARAKYFCADGCDDDDFHHYALNVPLYTHFTSPIRRYADIMVHR